MAKNEDIRKEMEQLRNQLDALKQVQQESGSDIEQSDSTADVEVLETSIKTAESAAGIDTESADESDLASLFQELMDVLDNEIKDSNPTTMLVVFSLGVLVGRLLPR